MRRMVCLLTLCLTVSHASGRDLMQVGRAYLAEGDNAAAAKSYGEALQVNPFDPVALNNLAVAKAAGGDYQAALELLTRAVRLPPPRPDIQENLQQLKDWMNGAGRRAVSENFSPLRSTMVLPDPPALWSETAENKTQAATAKGVKAVMVQPQRRGRLPDLAKASRKKVKKRVWNAK